MGLVPLKGLNADLKKLRILPWNYSIDDKEVKVIVQKFRELTELALPNKKEGSITNKGAQLIAELRQLEKLDLEGHPLITSRGFRYLIDKLPHLTWIKLTENSEISKIVEELKISRPSLTIEMSKEYGSDSESEDEG